MNFIIYNLLQINKTSYTNISQVPNQYTLKNKFTLRISIQNGNMNSKFNTFSLKYIIFTYPPWNKQENVYT